jgi:hypothetical protein
MRIFSATFPAHSTFLKIAAGTALALVLAFGATTGAQAKTGPKVGDQIHHYVMCFNLLLTNSAQHAKHCSPSNNAPGSLSSLTSFSGGAEPAKKCHPCCHKWSRPE